MQKRLHTFLCLTLYIYSVSASYAISPFEHNFDEITEGVLSSFSFDLQEKLSESKKQQWQEGVLDEFSLNLSYHYPLKKSASASRGVTKNRSASSVTSTITWNPISYWQASLSLYKYIDENAKQASSPDFTYSFGYSDWHPYTLSLIYSNFGGNRFNPKDGEQVTKFYEGTFTLGWNFVLKEKIQEVFRITDESNLACGTNLSLTPKFNDPNYKAYRKWKTIASLNCKYTIYDSWYFNFSLFKYPFPDQQMDWDADFLFQCFDQ